LAEKRLKIFFLIPILFLLLITAVSAQSDPALIDLSSSNLSENIVKLDGAWEFYWQKLLQPGEIEGREFELVKIPAAWNGYDLNGETLTGSGYATYRLRLNLVKGKQYGLKIPRIFTSYKLWVNGAFFNDYTIYFNCTFYTCQDLYFSKSCFSIFNINYYLLYALYIL
jgi:hypothetical protein